MLNENATLSTSEARHLLRRSGFGAPPKELDLVDELTRGQAADLLLAFKPAGFKPSGKSIEAVHDKWIAYMLKVKNPLQEKLVLFWHDHFATSEETVLNPKLMGLQNKLLRLHCKGNFKTFVKAMNLNPAMMSFLDTNDNRKDIPNENYARELMELFTLGVKDSFGNDNYTQADVVQIARAFTGWDFDDKGKVFLQEFAHDFGDGTPMNEFPERGPRVIFKDRGRFAPLGDGRRYDTLGRGPEEINVVTDIIFQHHDTGGAEPEGEGNTVARRTARRLLEYFAHPEPSLAFIDQVVGTGPTAFDQTWSIQDLLRRIFISDEFYDSAQVPLGPGVKRSVKWPIDYVVGTLRMLGMKPKSKDLIIANQTVRDVMRGMGQLLLEPPSVFGWDWETAWTSSTTVRARIEFVVSVVTASNGGKTTFAPEKLIDIGLTSPGAIVDAVTSVLGVFDQFDTDARQILIDYATDGGANPTLNLQDFLGRTKLQGIFALVLVSPHFQVH